MIYCIVSMVVLIVSVFVLFGIQFLLGVEVGVVDFNVCDFFGVLVGIMFGVFYLLVICVYEFYGLVDCNGKVELKINVVVYCQVFFSDICGIFCMLQFIIFFVDIDVCLFGSVGYIGEIGFGDFQVGGILFFVNDLEWCCYSGLLILIILLLGEYYVKNFDVLFGVNCWGVIFVYNYIQGIGCDWVLEVNLEVQFYVKNDDYFGSDLEQKLFYCL